MGELRFAGVDWASEEHALCVVGEQGRIVEGRRYRHSEPRVRALCGGLVRLRVALVALERPDGLLIGRLLGAGLAVIAVHRNQVEAMRPRFSVAGGKSDGFDGFVLAELARTDSDRFRVLVPDRDRTKALRAITRARDGLVRTRVGLVNQLRDPLASFWPGAANVFCAVDSRIALAFLRRYPTPLDARRLGEQRLDAFPERHGHPGRKPARELLARLRSGGGGTRRRARDPSPARARAGARLGARADRRPDQRAEHRDPSRARSAPRRADVPLAVHRHGLVAVRRDDARRERRPPRALPQLPGARRRPPPSPVAVESGNAKHAQFRAACDHRPRAALCTLADASRRHNPSAADIHDRARARGASHTHATRTPGHARSQIIWRPSRDHDTHDPNRHTAPQHLTAAGG